MEPNLFLQLIFNMMNYYSLTNHNHRVNFQQAVIKGLAPDRGLYFPQFIPHYSTAEWNDFATLELIELAQILISPFVNKEIPEDILHDIISDTLSFPFPLKELDKDVFALELFHGATMAFKDVGAKFLAGCLAHFRQEKELTILVATSGDTGGAVANSFLNVEGINVVILYPSGKVSNLQEKQLTTLGGNIKAIEVNGDFDSCQALVKQAFMDENLNKTMNLSSANSINIARWLPQFFYYLSAWAQLKSSRNPPVFSVPSGNFGNIAAGVLAMKMGMPVKSFIAATNSNDTVPRYFNNGLYAPEPTVATMSNAMDVSNPSNFVRLRALFDADDHMKQYVQSIAINEIETINTIKSVHQKFGYIIEPHGAVAYTALKKSEAKSYPMVFLETAHPIKFPQIVEDVLEVNIPIPDQVSGLLNIPKFSIKMDADYQIFRDFLETC